MIPVHCPNERAQLQGEAIVIERLGKFNRVLNPGFNCLIPGLDSPKQFSWNKTTVDRRGNVVSTGQTLTRVDLRETVFNFPPQPVYTVDTVQMRVSVEHCGFGTHEAQLALCDISDCRACDVHVYVCKYMCVCVWRGARLQSPQRSRYQSQSRTSIAVVRR